MEYRPKNCPKCSKAALQTIGRLEAHFAGHGDPLNLVWVNCTNCGYCTYFSREVIHGAAKTALPELPVLPPEVGGEGHGHR